MLLSDLEIEITVLCCRITLGLEYGVCFAIELKPLFREVELELTWLERFVEVKCAVELVCTSSFGAAS